MTEFKIPRRTNQHRPLPMDRMHELFTLENGVLMAGGKPAARKKHRYWIVRIDGERFYLSRVVYAMSTGKDPGHLDVDHIDRNPDNNHPGNLRAITRRENLLNTGLRSDNRSGYKGVSWHKRTQSWVASGYLLGKRIHLGYFDNIDDAINERIYWATLNNSFSS